MTDERGGPWWLELLIWQMQGFAVGMGFLALLLLLMWVLGL